MEYVYAALLLHKLDKEVNEANLSSVVKASGAEVNEAQVKSLVAALADVNIDEAVKAAPVAVAAAAAPAADAAAAGGRRPAAAVRARASARGLLPVPGAAGGAAACRGGAARVSAWLPGRRGRELVSWVCGRAGEV